MPVKGRAQAVKNIRRLTREAIDAFEDQNLKNAEELLSDAIDLAPQLLGDLVESGVVERVRGNKFLFTDVVGFNTPYAVRRHEDFYQPGPTTAGKPGAGRKYLSRPFNKKKKVFEKRIKNAIERRLRQVSAQLPGV